MWAWSEWLRRAAYLGRRAQFDRELDDEIRFHLETRAEELQQHGVPAAVARQRAQREFGPRALLSEDARAAWQFRWIDDLRRDLRHGARSFAKRPGFTAVAILSLGVGIGANAAAFSVIRGVLLEPLPYPASDRLVMISATADGDVGQKLSPTVPEYAAWRDRTHLFEGMATYGLLSRDLGADDTGAMAERVTTQQCTPSLFAVLGIPPQLGRTFTDAEDQIDRPATVVVISYRLWQRRFHGDPSVIGRRLRLDESTNTIVGVMPAHFVVADEPVDVWTPGSLTSTRLQGSARGWPVVARLKPGASVAEAQADVDAVSAQLGVERGATAKMGAVAEPLGEALFGSYRRPLAILEGTAAVVLLLACANVAGLLLAQAMARRAEFAIRSAIGAGRARLVRQLLIESLLLAGMSGGTSFAVAWLALKLLVAQGPFTVPRAGSIGLDGEVFLFGLAISALAVVLFGLVPALYVSKTGLVESLRSSHRVLWDPSRIQRLRGGLISAQIALSVMLLVAAGLLISTFVRVRANALGAEPKGVVTFTLQFAPTRFRQVAGSYSGLPLLKISPAPAQTTEDVWQRVQRLPGVTSAAVVNHVPFTGPGPFMDLTIDGAPVPGRYASPQAQVLIVTPNFFATMRIPVLRGRDFDVVDAQEAPWVAIVNDSMAKAFWPGRNPIGEHVRTDRVPDDQPREVVGIVADSRSSPGESHTEPVIYLPLVQQPAHYLAPDVWERLNMTFVARAADDPRAIVPGLRRVIAEVDSERPAVDVHLLTRDVSAQLAAGAYLASTMVFFALVATLLSVIGIYAVVAHVLAQRSRELGVRIVLGASSWDVWRIAFGQIGWCLGCGLTIGLAAALASTRLIQGVLWGIAPTDAPTYGGAAVVMTLAAVAAIQGPVRRVIATAPASVLKAE